MSELVGRTVFEIICDVSELIEIAKDQRGLALLVDERDDLDLVASRLRSLVSRIPVKSLQAAE